MGEKSGVVGKVVHYYWIIESAKKWIMECVNEHSPWLATKPKKRINFKAFALFWAEAFFMRRF